MISAVATEKKITTSGQISTVKTKSLTSTVTAACNLPVDQPQRVDISTFKRLKVSHVDSLIQNLWGHVSEGDKNKVITTYLKDIHTYRERCHINICKKVSVRSGGV